MRPHVYAAQGGFRRRFIGNPAAIYCSAAIGRSA
jgi:hypothetical protein